MSSIVLNPFTGQFDLVGSSGGGGGGTVTSVGLADSTGTFNITGSPVTTAGTLTLASFQTQAMNTFLAAPNGSSGAPTFRNIVAADLPNLSGTYVPQSEVGAANGVASLDSGGKVPVTQLPSTVMQYEGTWDPTTNTPTLSDGTGTNGFVYWVSAAFAGPIAGLSNPSMYNFQIGDIVIYSSSLGQWELTTPAAGVQSVNGTQGVVTVNAINQLTGDVTAGPASGSQSQVASLTATTNSTITTLTALSLPASQLTGTVAIANGGTGTATTSQNFVFAGPTSGSGAPSFRLLTSGDIPGGGVNYWSLNGTNDIYNNNSSGNVGIGTATPYVPSSGSGMLTVQSGVGMAALTTNGQIVLAGAPSAGGCIAGLGSSYDISILNGYDAVVIQIPTNTQTTQFLGTVDFQGNNIQNFTYPIRVITGDDSLSAATDVKAVLNQPGGGSFTVTLPAGATGMNFQLVIANANTATWTLATTGGDTLDSNVQSILNSFGPTPVTWVGGTWYAV